MARRKSVGVVSGAGGRPVLPYGRHWIDEGDVEEVVKVLRSDFLTQGPAVERFEAALCSATGAPFAVAVSSGTAALHLACLAAGVQAGDVGLTSPITFVASANCVAYCGATPGFVDVDRRTVTMDPDALEKACRKKAPKVVLPVDFAGQPADLPAVQAIARAHGAVVIEDAAHSLGASYRDGGTEVKAGACVHSDMAVLSFHPVKHVTTAEGGAVTTRDRALYTRLMDLRTHGLTKDPARLEQNDGPWYYEQHALGFNYRITDVQCALGVSQLAKLDRFVARRRALVDRYTHQLGGRSDVELLIERDGRRSSYHLLVAQIEGGRERRRRVYDALRQDGIHAQIHYIPVHTQPWYRKQHGFRPGDFPRAEQYYESCLSLPLFPKMADADVDRVTEALQRALEQTRA